MIIDTSNSGIWVTQVIDGERRTVPGLVLKKWQELREHVRILKAKTKEKVNFKVRSADELMDKMRNKCNELGLLVFPSNGIGKGHAIDGGEDNRGNPRTGTLAEVEVQVTAMAVEDGSYITFWGFGLGADQQDKAGGKAGTYAYKAALIQALLAGGAEDTDDDGEPLPGGVRKARKPSTPSELDQVRQQIEQSSTPEEFKAAYKAATTLPIPQQKSVRELLVVARARCVPGPGAGSGSSASVTSTTTQGE